MLSSPYLAPLISTGVGVVSGTLTTSGADIVMGSLFDSTLSFSEGNDLYLGGGGKDTVTFALAPAKIDVDLTRDKLQIDNDGTGATDSLVAIEYVVGSSFGDDDRKKNSLDTDLSKGLFDLDGGPGIDLIDYSRAERPLLINLREGYVGWLNGSTDDDRLLLRFEDVIGTGLGDQIIGSPDANDLDGGGGYDTAYYQDAGIQSIACPVGAETISVVSGGATDTLTGIERIIGSETSETIDLSDLKISQNDFGGYLEVRPGGGNDTITLSDGAGSGAESIALAWAPGDGTDTIDAAPSVLRLYDIAPAEIGFQYTTEYTYDDEVLEGAIVETWVYTISSLTLPGGGISFDFDEPLYAEYVYTTSIGTGELIAEGWNLHAGLSIEFVTESDVGPVVAYSWDLNDLVASLFDPGQASPPEAHEGAPPDDATISGSSGAETVGGTPADDIFFTAQGDDLIDSTMGSDTFVYRRGDGNDVIDELSGSASEIDTLRLTLQAADVAFARNGDDLVVLDKISDQRVVVTDQFASATEFFGIERLEFADSTYLDRAAIEAGSGLFTEGTSDADSLNGGQLQDILYGGGADDTLAGGDASDFVSGDYGNDVLAGDDGDDHLEGRAGSDTLFGGSGLDLLIGGDGDDDLYGGAGDDHLLGSSGADYLEGGDGADTLEGGSGSDIAFGDAGDDGLYLGSGNDEGDGGEGDDTVDGGSGSDMLFGGTGNDYISGRAGDDELAGGDNDDAVFGDEGNDVLQGGAGEDYLNGGAGGDSYEFASGDGLDTISNEDAISSDDRLTFGSGINHDEFWFQQDGEDLLVSVMGTSTDKVRIQGWFGETEGQTLDKFIAGDGWSLNESQVQQLVDAMASYAGGGGDPAVIYHENLPSTVQTAIAEAWDWML